MRQIFAKKNYMLLHEDGTIHYPFSKFLSSKFINPHTHGAVSKSLRILYVFCRAHRIELALRAVEGRCLSFDETKQLVDLCYRPIPEIEAMSDKKVVFLTGAKAGKAPINLPDAVESNTASKQANYISQYLKFFFEVFLDPNIRSSTLRNDLDRAYNITRHQMNTTITGTKQGHHHDIKSLPHDKFIEVIRAIFLRPEELFLSESGKISRNLLRDRAMALLACEGLRPGTLGNVTRTNYRPESSHLVITDNRVKRRERVTANTPVLKLGASTRVNSASETMIQLWPFTIEAIDDYINIERVAVLSKRLTNQSNGFLFLSEKGEPFKHRASITDMFSRLGIRLAELGLLEVGDDPYFPNVRKYDFCGSVLRHSSAALFLKHKGTDDRAKDQMKSRFGWTHNSNMPERYAARTISDQANINLMEFSENLIAEAQAKKHK
ncbi:hypothetical protein CFter6_2873 [Collimonas fungivorans]|uniref:Phage integrase family protein n=1 Tax=Collimonas fungivorans TaxID=158899 RepID=A0A127PCH8_9BURK|nr:hypothetical protein [Collimonas fungivorans]AMO95539.1 hypothetical protein CFter6_2873 [Collimonas fungivorans]